MAMAEETKSVKGTTATSLFAAALSPPMEVRAGIPKCTYATKSMRRDGASLKHTWFYQEGFILYGF